MIKKVSEFHYAFGVERGNVDVELRYKLFEEEFYEYKDAKTLVDKVDAIIDMLYIACGTIDLHEWNINEKDIKKRILTSEKDNLKDIESGMHLYKNEWCKNNFIGIVSSLISLAFKNDIYDKLSQLFEEVHLSNLSKLDDNGKPIINDGILDTRKPIGKILKSKNYFEPNLKDILYAN